MASALIAAARRRVGAARGSSWQLPAVLVAVLMATTVQAQTVSARCALTFDDGPGRYTAELLDVLKSRGVHASFFVLGEYVLREPDVIHSMVVEGHEVDNHSFDHPNLRHLGFAEQLREIDSTQRALNALGIAPRYFRPPYGAYNAETVRAAAQEGLAIALWTDDTEDWKYRSAHAFEARVDRDIDTRVGGIYLFHDIHAWTVAVMGEVIDRLARRGCRFQTLFEYRAVATPAAPGTLG
jgi:peptidoglycan/xylan/chitin deacetylase (PgdA/CDA1 family)